MPRVLFGHQLSPCLSSPPIPSLRRPGVCSINSASCPGSPAACMTCVSCAGLACGTAVTYPPWSARATIQGRRAVPMGAQWRHLLPSPLENARGARRRLGKALVSADRSGPLRWTRLRGPHRGSRACGRGWGRAWMGHRWSRCKENTFGRHEGDIFILTTKAESRSERRKSRQPPREKSAPNKQWDRNAQPLHLETRQAGSSQRLPLTHPSEAQGVPSPGHRRRVLPGSGDGRDRKSGSGSPTSTRGCSSTGGGSPPGPGTSWTDLLARPGLAP